jgi:wyosine [tRNA(Phe)-imidazoG37] synthetase (radical SAM superfamily)
MATFLFDEIIFGPVHSRRLGVSLGINLLYLDAKFCNFNCVYCECGWTNNKIEKKDFHSRETVSAALKKKLQQMAENNKLPDVITFAGNGEPTLHPDFETIINDTINIRNQLAPKCKIAVLSNATMLHRKSVFNALNKIENNILKLDSGIEDTIKLINQPLGKFSINELKENLKRFNSNLIIQTMFLKGKINSKTIDNTSNTEIEKWLEIISEVKPKQVMIYTISRDTPLQTLQKIQKNKLNQIASKVKKLGIDTMVSA